MKYKNILVTGGAGFVGSHLCEALVGLGSQVTSLDNYSSGKIKNHIPNVIYIDGDTNEIAEKISFLPDLIYHLGEYSRVETSFDDIALVNQSNIRGTASVLEFARVTGAKLVYSGSSTKFTNLDPNYQISPYAATKSINTDLVRLYGDCANLKYAITYFYNVFGGREIDTGQYSTVIAKFLKLRRENKPLTVTKPGSQRRNFTHINDIIDGLILVGDIGEGDGFGIGSDISFSIKEVAQLISNDVKLTPAKPGNRHSAWLNTQKTKDLGWRCKHSLIEYIKSHS